MNYFDLVLLNEVIQMPGTGRIKRVSQSNMFDVLFREIQLIREWGVWANNSKDFVTARGE
jgi:hypothetical protein